VINITLKPNNKPTKEGFYLVHRPKRNNTIMSGSGVLSARVIQNKYYNGGNLFLFLGEMSQFPLNELEEDCLWSDEIIVEVLDEK
jgi:hypothetical protein